MDRVEQKGRCDSIEYKGKKYRVDYKHCRKYELSCVSMKHDILPRGGETCAYINLGFDKCMNPIGGLVAYSYCADSDVYSKKIGRDICKKRLLEMITKLGEPK
jgi:hypothetical protein